MKEEIHHNVPASKIATSESICDWTTIAFACWTVCCHTAIAAGGGLKHLITLYLFGFPALAMIVYLIRKRENELCKASPEERIPASAEHHWAIRVIGLVLGIVGVTVFIFHQNMTVLWWWAVGLLTIAAGVFLVSKDPQADPPLRTRYAGGFLWALAFACVVLTLVSHRPDADDAFYVNVAVAAADQPERALLSGDSLHGIDGLPLHLPVHKFHSYELLNAAISYLTEIPAIYSLHLICAAIAAFLVPLSHARLFRLLSPRVWPWAVAALVLVLIAAGETHRWYGNFAFVRMWQGKSIYLFVFLPLIYAYALIFVLRPTIHGWILLSFAQIAAVGCSSSAIWGAPVATMSVLVSMARPSRRNISSLGLGALSSVPVLLAGMVMKNDMQNVTLALFEHTPTKPGYDLKNALITVLGDSNLLIIGILSILVAWAFTPNGLAHRFSIGVPLVVSLSLLNPYAATWVAAHATGPSYWRSLWAMPIPILLALILISPLHLGGRTGSSARWISFAMLLILFVVCVPEFSGISKENNVKIDFPKLKVPAEDYEWARALNESVSPGSQVAAPSEVNTWVVTFHDHAYPLLVRHYLHRNQAWSDVEDLRRRTRMVRFVTGLEKSKNSLGQFREGLEKYEIEGVCLQESAYSTVAGETLKASGFHRTIHGDDYEIWVLTNSPVPKGSNGKVSDASHRIRNPN